MLADVGTDGVEPVGEQLEVNLDGAATRLDLQVRHAPEDDAAVAHRARDVEAGDVLLRVGHELDDLAAPHPLNEQQAGREHDDHRDDEKQSEARVALVHSHG